MWELSQTEGEVNHNVSVQIDFNFRIVVENVRLFLAFSRCQTLLSTFYVSHLQLQRQDAVDQIAVSHFKSPSSGCVWFSCWIGLLVKLVNLYWTSTRCLFVKVDRNEQQQQQKADRRSHSFYNGTHISSIWQLEQKSI